MLPFQSLAPSFKWRSTHWLFWHLWQLSFKQQCKHYSSWMPQAGTSTTLLLIVMLKNNSLHEIPFILESVNNEFWNILFDGRLNNPN